MRAEVDELWFCGQVIAPEGLEAAGLFLAENGVGVELCRSGYDGSFVLRGRGALMLDMEAGQGPEKVFSGTVEADAETALRLLRALSEALVGAGLRHRIELYRGVDGPLLGCLHHAWPGSAAE